MKPNTRKKRGHAHLFGNPTFTWFQAASSDYKLFPRAHDHDVRSAPDAAANALRGAALDTLDRFLPKGLFVLSAGLLCWGLWGLFEYAFPAWHLGLQDSNFPAGLQFIHFLAISLTGSIFVFGYLKRWPHTRHATITMYAVLATICFIETMDFGAFGGGTTGVMIMLAEFALYIGLSTYLLRSDAIRKHFQIASPRPER